MRLEITRVHPDTPTLRRRVWRFNVSIDMGGKHINVKLDRYIEESRPSTRHRNWREESRFSSRRDRDFHQVRQVTATIDRDAVPMPPDVYDEIHALLLLNTRIT